ILDDDAAWEELRQGLLQPTVEAAAAGGYGIITDALVWRASPDYVEKLGYAASDVQRINRDAVARVDATISAMANPAGVSMILSAEVGPRGDGYSLGSGQQPEADRARDYHTPQIAALAETDIALLAAWTLTSATEAIGIAKAASDVDLPIIISPTVETDGRLPDGTSLAEFVRRVDDSTHGSPLFYMANCAHPTHVDPVLRAAHGAGESWVSRFDGFRANASSKSHEELDNSAELDRGDPHALATHMAAMQASYGLTVLGGCCGTDSEHIEAIAEACVASV
ncbi:homocysteine S-methyltransferase family protein, partial [Candidatus Poribacteria bacterium]|nr:homocysteine S-methyltransferase family protein [Candidatus Poribacteria bacterium]